MGNTDISPESTLPKGRPDRKVQATPGPLLVSDLRWTAEEARETRARLATLEEDWEAPGMHAYDHL